MGNCKGLLRSVYRLIYLLKEDPQAFSDERIYGLCSDVLYEIRMELQEEHDDLMEGLE